MKPVRTLRAVLLLLLILPILPIAVPAQPLIKPFTFVMPSYDSLGSAWLPQMPADNVDGRGFLAISPEGHLRWSDGERARLVGVNVTGTACFPDSADATATANRLAKLGVNIVRFVYFDYHNSNGSSTLAPGNRSDTLSANQMKKLDWFLHQLKRKGIRAHLVLKARNGPRRDDNVPGWDSTYGSGQYITHFSEPFQRMQQRYMNALFNHVNPYTGRRYGDDPVIALVTISDQNSLYDNWINDRLNRRQNFMSFQHSRMIDTMFANFLRKRHGTTAALRTAYREGITTTGPNIVKNGGFESFTDNWSLVVGEGAQANAVIVQGGDVPPGEGSSTLRIAVRAVNGNEGRIYVQQTGLSIRKNGIYKIVFKAKTDLAAGRQMRVVMQRGVAPSDNFGLNETIDITNQWKSYEFTIRSSGTDSISTILRFFMGRTMGDILLDGISVQETGREGLLTGETLEAGTVARATFRDAPKMSLQRMYDQVDFYDSLSRAYYRTMHAHLRSLGVQGPIAGTNNCASSADAWVHSEYDFTSETAQWDFNGARATGIPYSDSTWVIRQYSVLRYRDQKIPELARNAITGKPFIAESYMHAFPNRQRSEMMLFLPSYASLHDWDGIYLYNYSDRNTEMGNRRRVFKDDFASIIADPSICALLPQVSAMMRGGWIEPSERRVGFKHDVADLRNLPATYSARGFFQVEGTFNSVANLVSGVRIDSFTASRHYTADDYYVTIPSDDNIESDTRQIKLDITKGILQLNTPRVQGASGALGAASTIRTDNLGISWNDGGPHVTCMWSTLDTFALDSSRRSLLTVTTRALNSGAVWQYGDSSMGKSWGDAPMQMESVRLGMNFHTAADSVILHPLDSMAQPTGRTIGATRTTSGSWRVMLDLESEKTPWFGVEQLFTADTSTSGITAVHTQSAGAGDIYPNPAHDAASIDVTIPAHGAVISGRICDMLGRTMADIPAHRAIPGSSTLPLDLRGLPAGSYVCIISIGETVVARRMIVR